MTDSGSGIDPASARFAVNDEYGRVQPGGNLSVGPDGSYAFTVSLEASRDENDVSGRTYTLSVSARDKAGNSGLGSRVGVSSAGDFKPKGLVVDRPSDNWGAIEDRARKRNTWTDRR